MRDWQMGNGNAKFKQPTGDIGDIAENNTNKPPR